MTRAASSVRVSRRSAAALLSVSFMTLSAVIRAVYFLLVPAGTWKLISQCFLPLAAAVLFFCCVVYLGEKHFAFTSLPVLMGVAFFIFKSLTFGDLLHTVLCIGLYSLVAALYVLTSTAIIRTKLPALLVFGLPFLYHVFVEDTRLYVFADPPVPFVEWLPEISVLLIMASLFTLTLAMKRK